MAYHEIRLLAAKVLFNFNLELCEESRNWMEQKVFVLWEKNPLMCKLTALNTYGTRTGTAC
ncbi:cytochrome P450 [Apiospora sp. TS-2023a]